MANLPLLVEQNQTVSFRDPPLYLSVRLCVHECMHMLGTRVQDLGENMRMWMSICCLICILTKEHVRGCVSWIMSLL